jgi:hypothetical protein
MWHRPHSGRGDVTSLGLLGLVGLVAVGLLAGCGGSSAPAVVPPSPIPIRQFLQLPVATPSSCAADQHGSASGRLSPWAGVADISIFLRRQVTAGQQRELLGFLDRNPVVDHAIFESKAEAYAEYQRLYTCSALIPPGALPASYRVVLGSQVSLAARNALIGRLYRLPGIAMISCDPSAPCTGITAGRH